MTVGDILDIFLYSGKHCGPVYPTYLCKASDYIRPHQCSQARIVIMFGLFVGKVTIVEYIYLSTIQPYENWLPNKDKSVVPWAIRFIIS